MAFSIYYVLLFTITAVIVFHIQSIADRNIVPMLGLKTSPVNEPS